MSTWLLAVLQCQALVLENTHDNCFMFPSKYCSNSAGQLKFAGCFRADTPRFQGLRAGLRDYKICEAIKALLL